MATKSGNPLGMRRKPRQARSQERVNRILDVAEQLFIETGYEATTTTEIATRAEVPIGSLYQFFPDKAALLFALWERYSEQLRQQIATLETAEMMKLSLPEFVERTVETTNQFFTDCPGYHAIFIQVQGTLPELAELENAADAQFIADWAVTLRQRQPSLSVADCEAIAFVLVKAIGLLLWLSLGQEPACRERLVAETKRFTLSYLQSYHPQGE
ncbi:MAG: TetR/AcrR family transcriptional regulator [Spirulinaceae cyanobacterium SM2_1_0]|nr:TetR/AcrR family transcriptional regulator [Spirulinaceae cyanobacterium SM2_1_0]